MKGIGYVALLLLIFGWWFAWQVLRRVSAGAKAMINPERYAIEKVVQMQRDAFNWDAQRPGWQIATEYYPDLIDLNRRLNRLSEELASEFRAKLLETKQFNERNNLVEQMEGDFLTKNFGRNPDIVQYARGLLQSRNKTAADELQRTVAVLGNEIDAAVIIARVQSKYSDAQVKAPVSAETLNDIARRLLRTRYVSDARALIEALGGRISETRISRGFFGQEVLHLQLGEREFQFETYYEMTQWLIREVVPTLITGRDKVGVADEPYQRRQQ
jgi:hypothetical protein